MDRQQLLASFEALSPLTLLPLACTISRHPFDARDARLVALDARYSLSGDPLHSLSPKVSVSTSSARRSFVGRSGDGLSHPTCALRSRRPSPSLARLAGSPMTRK